MPMTNNWGGDPYSKTDLTGTAVAAVTTQCRIFNLQIFNAGALTTYVQFFDAASASDVTLGTTVPTRVRAVPAGGGIDTAHYAPLRFNTGLVIAATTTATGNTAPATALSIDFDWIR